MKNKLNILVTGGTGYIGSHTCISLIEAGHSVVIIDNLSNSKKDVIDKIKFITGVDVPFHHIDATDETLMDKVFTKYNFDGVIHFAGYKAVGESVEKPLAYYMNNLLSTIVVSKMCSKHKVHKFVFSSSATVYGDNQVPFIESMTLLPTTNPYGETKAMSERILKDFSKSNQLMSFTLLRYFNPVGAHTSGLIGELPNGRPNNLMPFITQVAKGSRPELSVFGDDYDTVDGTGVRDYIHVVDLALGHVAAIENDTLGVSIYNLGTGNGTSVVQLIEAFKTVNNIAVPYKIVDRRPGDIASCYANVDKAKVELGWTAQRTIEDMCKDSWHFEKNL